MQIQSQVWTGSWDWTICPLANTVCSGLLWKTVSRWWRIISAKFKRQLNSESLKVKFHVIVANIDSVSRLLLDLSGTKAERNYTETRPLSASHRIPFWAKTGDFWRWEVRKWSFTAAQTSQNQILASSDKGKTLLACGYLCRYVSWIVFCNLIIICQQFFS